MPSTIHRADVPTRQTRTVALPVEVIRSRKRRKTVHAELVDGVVRVHMPAWVGADEEREVVAELVAKLERRYTSAHVDLVQRAAELAERFGFPEPASIRWADNQIKRWGSCSMPAGTIRISTRLAAFPPWVLDSVIVHELAHLVELDHSKRFYELVARFPLTEKADGFLLGVNYREDGDVVDGGADDGFVDGDDSADVIELEPPARRTAAAAAVEPAVTSRHPRARAKRRPVDDPNALTLF